MTGVAVDVKGDVWSTAASPGAASAAAREQNTAAPEASELGLAPGAARGAAPGRGAPAGTAPPAGGVASAGAAVGRGVAPAPPAPVPADAHVLNFSRDGRQRPAIAERLWRVRKDHRMINAIVQVRGGAEGASLTIDYNGEATYSCRLPTHDLAVREAGDRLHDFLRQGWSTHW